MGLPLDLDLHLTVPTTPSRAHLFKTNQGSLSQSPFAALDRDDTDGFGPEYIDIMRLLPGTYRFSVYIKQEPSASISPTVKNRFRAAGITLQAAGPADAGSTTYAYAVHSPDDDGADWSAWSQVYVDIEGLNPSSQESAGIDISITPNNINAKDVGSILVASPSLEFLPDN